jgi:hypothetical protein
MVVLPLHRLHFVPAVEHVHGGVGCTAQVNASPSLHARISIEPRMEVTADYKRSEISLRI